MSQAYFEYCKKLEELHRLMSNEHPTGFDGPAVEPDGPG